MPEGIPTTATHKGCNGRADEKIPPGGGRPPFATQVAKPDPLFSEDD